MSGIVTFKPPRAVRLLAKHGAEALKPSLEKGRYIGPLVSPRVAAVVRKKAIINGTFGQFSLPYGGWDPQWDDVAKIHIPRPFKGHIRERNRVERVDKVTKAMKGMPDRFQKYQQEVEERKPKKDILYMFKRVAEMSKKKKGSGPVKK